MAFKVRRQSRKMRYIHDFGLLPYEAQSLSQIPMKVPYMHRLLMERRKLLRTAIRDGWTQKQYENEIKRQYEDNNWKILPSAITRTKSVGVHDPWAMLRAKRDDFIRDFPDAYMPPPGKRRGKARELDEEKLEKGRRKKYKGDVASQRLRSTERVRVKRVLERELADIPGVPIYDDKTKELLGRSVEYRGRVYTVRKDGTIL